MDETGIDNRRADLGGGTEDRQAGDPCSDESAGGSAPPMDGPTVLVVGGGVSGCACAATLASHGVSVLVLSGALDSVGQPSLGPDVLAPTEGWGRIHEVLEALPGPLRDAWLAAATASEEGWPCFAVDRRMLSVETKRALERMEGLRFRQGLVLDLRLRPLPEGHGDAAATAEAGGRSRGQLAVETAFGEVVEADVVVLSVGLGLGGLVRVGDDVLPGGRYGETPAPGLRSALERFGVGWKEARGEVGPRYGGGGRAGLRVADENSARGMTDEVASCCGVNAGSLRMVRGRALAEVLLQSVRGSSAAGGFNAGAPASWPADYPAAPHWEEALRSRQFGWREVEECVEEKGVVKSDEDGARPLPCLLPDGAATGEVYLRPGAAGTEELPEGRIASRLGQEISALAVDGLGPRGRLDCDRFAGLAIWVVGRASGARDYLESLASGVRAAEEILECVRGGKDSFTGGGRG